MLPYSPQNGEEAGYIAFALVDALAAVLISKGIIDGADLTSVLEIALSSFEPASNDPRARSAEFLRRTILDKE